MASNQPPERDRRRPLPVTAAVVVLVFLIVVLIVGCGGGGDDGLEAARSATPATMLEVTARNSRFDKKGLAAPPNTDVSLRLVNRDAGTLHNIAIYTDKSAKEKIFGTELFPGDATRDYQFKTPGPGEHFFRCDIHPDVMRGTFAVR